MMKIKKISIGLVIVFILNIFVCISSYARCIIFSDINFEDSDNPTAGMVFYGNNSGQEEDNTFQVMKWQTNHYGEIEKNNENDCMVDYSIGLKVDNIVAESNFIVKDIETKFSPFYFIGSTSDEKKRQDFEVIYVDSDMGLYMLDSKKDIKLATLDKEKNYNISVVLKFNEKCADIYLDGTKLATKDFTSSDFQRLKTVRTWLRKQNVIANGHTRVVIDNYRIYESDTPLEKLPDMTESVFDDDGVERIKANEIIQIFDEKTRTYPRLFADESDFKRAMNSSDKRTWYNKIKNAADSLISQPNVKYELSDGYRLLNASREVLKRMQLWGFMYQMTNDTKYLNRGIQELNNICEFKDWHPEHFLDTAEMMTAAAIGYDWFYNGMTEEQRKKVSDNIITKGLKPTQLAYYGRLTTGGIAGPSMNFVMDASNMNIVDNCGAIIAATSVFECDKELCADIIEKAIRSLDYPLKKFEPDGSWDEGPNYWVYMSEYLTRAMAALNKNFGSDFGISQYSGISKTAKWIISLDSPNGVNPYHDTWNGMKLDTFSLAGLGKFLNQDSVINYRIKTISGYDYMPSVYDMLWCYPQSDNLNIANENYTRNGETVSIRENYFNENGSVNKTGLFFSTHGGMNNAYHSHIDAGAFIFDIDGVRWATELPPENYNSVYGTDRTWYYRVRPEGHNTVVINPSTDAGQILNAASTVTEHCFTEKDAYAIYDMTDIYKDSVNEYKRGFYVGDNRRSLTIRDEISLKADSSVYWFMHTNADIAITENGAILTQNGKKLRLTAKSNCKMEVFSMNAEPMSTSPNPTGQSDNTGTRKVAIKLTGGGNADLEVKLSPYSENLTEMIDGNLSEWNSKAKSNSDWTVYNFEDDSLDVDNGFSEINKNSITELKRESNVFGNDSNSLCVAQKETTKSDVDQWYQLRATVKPVNKKYQYIHFEQAYNNQFADRWLTLKFNNSNEMSIPFYKIARNASNMNPEFYVNNKSYGKMPIKFSEWNSYDIVIDMENKSYDMYVNGTQMAENIKLTLKKDDDLTTLDELQFGINHQWNAEQNKFSAVNTYMDNIIVKPLEDKPTFNNEDFESFRDGIASTTELADEIRFKTESGIAIVKKYNSDTTKFSIETFNKGINAIKVTDGDYVKIFNWRNFITMTPLNNPIEFNVKYN